MPGRPNKFDDPEAFKKMVDDFFLDCEEREIIPTVTRLALALDTNRKDLLNYENELLKNLDPSIKREISNTIKKAKARIEVAYEDILFHKGKTAGAIFTLKNNYGWQDKQEIVQTTNNRADLSGLTDEQIKELLKM